MAEIECSISNFYRNKSILITGSSGFLGKVLIEKLLRSCPDIETIYLLLRSKKNQEPKQRLEELLKSKLFERVKNEQPGALYKLVAIPGDVSKPGLGIESSDEKLLLENVSIVFHSAANVKFDLPLKQSVPINVLGTRRILQLCRKMEKLEALVYVSTALSYCNLKVIEEVVYRLQAPVQKIVDTIEWLDESLVEMVTPHLIQGRPNNYTYTKALTESLLFEECGDLPVTIVRPSIVTATWKEPVPGWIDNQLGATGLMVAVSKGLIHTMYSKPSSAAELIPADVVINLLISAAWHTATHRPQNIIVYNCTSSNINKVTWETIKKHTMKSVLKYPSNETFSYPEISYARCKIEHYMMKLLYHHIPAYFFDFLFILTGRPRKLVPLYRKIHTALDALEYFRTDEWTYISKNALMLQEQMSPEDRREFNFDIESLDWPAHIENYIFGIRKFFFKEDPSTIPSARGKLQRLLLYKRLRDLVITLSLCQVVFSAYSGAQKVWCAILCQVKEIRMFWKSF